MSENQIATTTGVEPSIGLMLQKVIDRGVTTENVAALEKLCDLYERVEAKKSERLFNEAFTKLQSELPNVAATKPVPNRDGTVRYVFAPYESIMEVVKPLLVKNGFSVSFDSRFGDGRLTVICTLAHVDGHSRKNEFAVRIGGGPPGSSETQADGAAKTYAKRGALSDALNIVVDKDDDARLIGKPIGMALAADLRDRVEAVGADEQAFLKYAGVACKNPATLDDYIEIPDDRYDSLDELLKKKEGRRA